MFIEVTQVNTRSQFSRDPEGPITLNSGRILSVKSAPENNKGAKSVVEFLVEYNCRRFVYAAESKAVIDDLLRTRAASNAGTEGQLYANQ